MVSMRSRGTVGRRVSEAAMSDYTGTYRAKLQNVLAITNAPEIIEFSVLGAVGAVSAAVLHKTHTWVGITTV